MHYIINACLKPKVILQLFPTYHQLKWWLQNHRESLEKTGATINKMDHTICFQNGSILYLGYGETEEDFNKYLGLEYDKVIGGSQRLRDRERNFF